MDAWYQCGNPYPFVPQDILDRADSVRASLPNTYCDPAIAADLFEEVLDEFMLCDDHGLNVVAIEHHAGINSLFGANPLILGILARQTRNVRILSIDRAVSVRHEVVENAPARYTAPITHPDEERTPTCQALNTTARPSITRSSARGSLS